MPSAANPAQPIDVCITVDTEFSIGGAFADSERYRPLSEEVVDCRVDGQEHGLGFLLETLATYDAKATFFVEALQSFYFGDAPMGRIAERIASAGHDVQIHLHPCWMHFCNQTWRTLPPDDDSCATRSVGELQEMINFALNLFARWGQQRPTALRTGGFRCSQAVYKAMALCGLRLGSNAALGVYQTRDPNLRLANGRHFIEGVLEVPALSYEAPLLPKSGLRTFAITATDFREMESLLWQARRQHVSPVVVLTHPFEFIKKGDFRYTKLSPNKLTQNRLKHLLRFVADHGQDFRCATFGTDGGNWIAAGSAPSVRMGVSRLRALARTAENVWNDFV